MIKIAKEDIFIGEWKISKNIKKTILVFKENKGKRCLMVEVPSQNVDLLKYKFGNAILHVVTYSLFKNTIRILISHAVIKRAGDDAYTAEIILKSIGEDGEGSEILVVCTPVDVALLIQDSKFSVYSTEDVFEKTEWAINVGAKKLEFIGDSKSLLREKRDLFGAFANVIDNLNLNGFGLKES